MMRVTVGIVYKKGYLALCQRTGCKGRLVVMGLNIKAKSIFLF